MKSVLTCLVKYAVFRGRAGIGECFAFLFFVIVCLALALGLDLLMGWGRENVVEWTLWYPTFETTRMVLVLPFFAVTVRRLRDANRSAWMALLWFVPVVGWVYLVIQLVQPGDEKSNRWGPPVEEAAAGLG